MTLSTNTSIPPGRADKPAVINKVDVLLGILNKHVSERPECKHSIREILTEAKEALE